uniref:Uncharacterized protein n=1 Tax=Moniliophthora roreri TaxID=221103 RepID=A0A0W0FPD7_MONRR
MDNHEFRSVSGSDSYTSAEHNAPELWLSIPTADDLDIISGDPDFQEFVRILEDDGVDLLKPGTDEGVLVGSGDGAATYPNDLQDTQHSSATHVATFSQLSTIALGSFDSPLHTNGAYLYDAWNLPAVSSSDINVPNSAVHHYLAESYPIPSPVYQYESNDFQQPMPVTSGLKKTLPDFVEGSSRQPEELEERIDPPFSNPSSRITLDISHR